MVALTRKPAFATTQNATARFALEWALVLFAAPVLMFPLVAPVATAAILTLVASIILAGLIFDGQGVRLRELAGSLGVPCVVLVLFVILGALVSDFPRLTVPKLCGVALGLLLFRAVLVTAGSLFRVRLLVLVYLAAGCAIVVSGIVVNPSWPDKVKFLRAVALQIPVLSYGLPGAEVGVNANALGGTTLFFLPLVLVVLGTRWTRWCAQMHPVESVMYFGSAALMTSILLLSQSRTAWVSGLATTAVVVAFGVRTAKGVRAAVLSFLVAAAVVLMIWLWPPPAERPSLVSHFGGRALPWSLALQAIGDNPVTGVGLGSFRAVAPTMYPATPPIDIANAHNVFLQVALDAGLPGLLAYLSLLSVATKMTMDCVRSTGGFSGALCFGLWASLLAVHMFGMTDAIALGAKVSVFFWWNLALIAALHALVGNRAETRVTARC